jgi:hypothetical protein
MAVVEFLFVQMETLQSRHPLGAVPGIGEQNTAYIPEEGLNWQKTSPPVNDGLSHAGSDSLL